MPFWQTMVAKGHRLDFRQRESSINQVLTAESKPLRCPQVEETWAAPASAPCTQGSPQRRLVQPRKLARNISVGNLYRAGGGGETGSEVAVDSPLASRFGDDCAGDGGGSSRWSLNHTRERPHLQLCGGENHFPDGCTRFAAKISVGNFGATVWV